MKKALTAGLVLAGVLAVSGSALAAPYKPDAVRNMQKIAQQTQNQKPPMPPEGFDGKRPPMSRDIRNGQNRPPMPPDGKRPPRSGDRKPPEFDSNRQPPKGVQPK